MALRRFEITVTFTYKTGETGGRLHHIVKGKATIDKYLADCRKWLDAHGHIIGEITVKEVA